MDRFYNSGIPKLKLNTKIASQTSTPSPSSQSYDGKQILIEKLTECMYKIKKIFLTYANFFNYFLGVAKNNDLTTENQSFQRQIDILSKKLEIESATRKQNEAQYKLLIDEYVY